MRGRMRRICWSNWTTRTVRVGWRGVGSPTHHGDGVGSEHSAGVQGGAEPSTHGLVPTLGLRDLRFGWKRTMRGIAIVASLLPEFVKFFKKMAVNALCHAAACASQHTDDGCFGERPPKYLSVGRRLAIQSGLAHPNLPSASPIQSRHSQDRTLPSPIPPPPGPPPPPKATRASRAEMNTSFRCA